MTKNIVLVTQEENWQDDGGSHNPIALTVSEEDYLLLRQLEKKDPDEVAWEVIDNILDRSTKIDKFPIMIDGLFNIWYKY